MTPRTAFSTSTKAENDALALQLLSETVLRRHLLIVGKPNIVRLRRSIAYFMSTGSESAMPPTVDSVEVHQRLVKGLPGEAVLIATAMAFDTFKEGQIFFGLSARAVRSRVGRRLDSGKSEKALRLVQAAAMAARVLGSAEDARAYLKTRNIALGGMTPCELLITSQGSQLVLNELQTHADCGPV